MHKCFCCDWKDSVGDELVGSILKPYDHTERFLVNQRGLCRRVEKHSLEDEISRSESTSYCLPIRFSKNPCGSSAETAGRMIWIRRIGSRYLDRRKVNILVLDTEVYSNTGGQTSKASPARSKCKIFYHRKVNGEERSCMAGDRLRKYICCADRIRRQWSAHGQNSAGSWSIRRSFAYQHTPLHCSWLWHGRRSLASDQRSEIGLLAALPLQSSKPKGERLVIDSKEPTIPVSDFMHSENRFEIITNSDPTLGAEFISNLKIGITMNGKTHRAEIALSKQEHAVLWPSYGCGHIPKEGKALPAPMKKPA